MATWFYKDSDGNTAVMSRALRAVQATPWPALSQEEQARTLRALIVASLVVLDAGSARPPRIDAGVTVLGTRTDADFSSDVLRRFNSQIMATWFIAYVAMTGSTALPGDAGGPPLPPKVVTTLNGQPPVYEMPELPGVSPNVGSLLVAEAIVAVAGIAAATLTIIHIVDKIGQVSVMNESTRADAQVAIASTAAAIEDIKNHLDAEAKAGKSIPWSQPELDVLDVLKGAQAKWWARIAPDPGTVLPKAQPGEPGIVKTVQSSVNLAILIAGAIAALYFLK